MKKINNTTKCMCFMLIFFIVFIIGWISTGAKYNQQKEILESTEITLNNYKEIFEKDDFMGSFRYMQGYIYALNKGKNKNDSLYINILARANEYIIEYKNNGRESFFGMYEVFKEFSEKNDFILVVKTNFPPVINYELKKKKNK